MNVLFVFASIGNLPAYENVIRELCKRGHRVIIHHGQTTKKYFTDHSLQAIKSEFGELCDDGSLLIRKHWRGLLGFTRQLLNRTPYLSPLHPSPWLINRNTGFAPFTQRILDLKPMVMMLKSKKVQEFIRGVESRIPSDPSIKQWLQQNRPDIVIGSPCIYARQDEMEYLRAANELGIPTIVSIFSWDHLLTKGTLHVLPDWLMVWNQNLADDAVTLHSMPKDRIFLTGAPHFDVWFEKTPTLDYGAFCNRVGLDPDRKYIAYLCSAVRGDESTLVHEFADALSADPETRDLSVLVRPYPSKSDIWDNFEKKNVVIWPKKGSIPNSSSEKDDYYHTIYHSLAVAGISTTAFVESAVIDKPCLVIMTDQYSYEHRMGHFLYLLDADFLEIARDVNDFTSILHRIMQGEDAKAAQRDLFVTQFTRPWGKHLRASQIMAEAIELVAQNGTLNEFSPQGNSWNGVKIK